MHIHTYTLWTPTDLLTLLSKFHLSGNYYYEYFMNKLTITFLLIYFIYLFVQIRIYIYCYAWQFIWFSYLQVIQVIN